LKFKAGGLKIEAESPEVTSTMLINWAEADYQRDALHADFTSMLTEKIKNSDNMEDLKQLMLILKKHVDTPWHSVSHTAPPADAEEN